MAKKAERKGGESVERSDRLAANAVEDKKTFLTPKRLETMCGGKITISPREGGGTSVKVTIPASADLSD